MQDIDFTLIYKAFDIKYRISEKFVCLPRYCNYGIQYVPTLTHIRIFMNNEAHSENFESCFDCKNN